MRVQMGTLLCKHLAIISCCGAILAGPSYGLAEDRPSISSAQAAFCKENSAYRETARLYDGATHALLKGDYRTGDSLLDAGLLAIRDLDRDPKPGAYEHDDTGQMLSLAGLFKETGKFKEATQIKKRVLSSKLNEFRFIHSCKG